MKRVSVGLFVGIISLFLTSPGISAQSTDNSSIEIGIFDAEKNKFDPRSADYATSARELDLMDITASVFKKFVFTNELGKEETLLIMKQSSQSEIYRLTSENTGKILVICVDRKLYSYALIRDGIASPLVLQKL